MKIFRGFQNRSARQWRYALPLCGIVIAGGLLWGNTAKLEDPSILYAPCFEGNNTNGKGYLPQCNALMYGTASRDSAKTGPLNGGMYAMVTRELRAYVGQKTIQADSGGNRISTDETLGGLYQGIERDIGCPPGTKIGAVCDLNAHDSEGNVHPEILRTNAAPNTSCGDPVKITVKCGVAGGVESTAIELGGINGRREGSYFQGARIQALKCHSASVLAEITKSRALILKDPAAIKMNADFRAFVDVELKQLYAQLGKSANDILQCDGYDPNVARQIQGDRAGTSVTANADIRLCAIRAQVTTAFYRIVSYEIFSRMQASYNKFQTEAGNAQWVDASSKTISEECSNRCKAEMNNSCSDSNRATDCAQRCYNELIVNKIRDKANQMWPLPKFSVSCQSDQWVFDKASCWPTEPGGAKCE